MSYNYLNKINYPKDLKKYKVKELIKIAKEVRKKTIHAVSKTGGHLGAGLGVVELTVALHYVFNTPHDKLIWDVGHQSYPHKILTGRKNQIETIRQGGGLYGFVKRSESEYDTFGTAHSSTSISAGLGIKIAKDLKNQESRVICVIGDGALSAGMAYEAMNNAGSMNKQLIVILNDNDMSIDRPVGAMSNYLSKLLSSKSYTSIRSIVKKISNKFPKTFSKMLYRAEEYSKGFIAGGTLFEELGFFYLGPLDGHNIDHLVPVLENIKSLNLDKPILLHVITKKGKGYAPAEKSDDKFHGVNKFDIISGAPIKKSSVKTYSKIFGETLTQEATKDDAIVAVTPAMTSGSGLNSFAQKFPNRFFDVGIAEQHAITMCAGMATEGLKPFAAIYSTFLQRAYDQVIHDVAIQKLPVRFAIDRAGQVGPDGPTHAGSFDIAFLSCLPNFIVMAAGDEQELRNMIKTSILIEDCPSSFRFPRGSCLGLDISNEPEVLEIGRGRILQEGNKIALFNFGARLAACKEAGENLLKKGIKITLIDARFAKPLDTKLIDEVLENHEYLITIEEGSIGGFSSLVLNYIHNLRKKTVKTKIKNIFFPDYFVPHDTSDNQYMLIEMDAKSIEYKILNLFGEETIILNKSAEYK